MRLLFVDGGTVPNGSVNWTARMARQLACRGHEVDLACRPRSPLVPLLRDEPIRLHVLPMRHSVDLGSVLALSRRLRALRPEAVLLQGSRAIRLAGAALVLCPTPAVARMGIGRSLKHSAYDRWVYRHQITHFLVNALAVERELAAVPWVGEGRVSTIYNGVDLDRFAPVRGAQCAVRGESELYSNCAPSLSPGGRPAGAQGTAHRVPVVACVARLTAEKGHRDLITALPKLVSRFPGLRLLLAGDGPLREALVEQAAALGVTERLVFLGHVADVRSVLAAADVLVLPSYREGLPNAVLEAMAMEVPVVATDTDGTAEAVVDGETGFLVPPGSPEALARAVTRVLEDDAGRAAVVRSARALVNTCFAPDRAADELEALLQRVAGYGTARLETPGSRLQAPGSR
jgi:glycosyltransferase involved in cell wall biosynthesis